jgi:beta-lactamase class D
MAPRAVKKNPLTTGNPFRHPQNPPNSCHNNGLDDEAAAANRPSAEMSHRHQGLNTTMTSDYLYRTTLLLAFVLATASVSLPVRAENSANWTERADFARYFAATGTVGTLLIYDLRQDRTLVHNSERARTRFTPASTFKIPNSLIGLETGAVRDADGEVFKWDGVTRQIAPWNRDHTLRSAIRDSVVPVYQEIARRIGPERMRDYVARIGYGNNDIGDVIDRFWLQGPLAISAEEQIGFLTRLYRDDLPFSGRTLALVKDIMVVEAGIDYTIRAKTGWDGHVTPNIGWWVGWVERGADVIFFALNMDMSAPSHLAARMEIVRAILRDLDYLRAASSTAR